MRSSSDRKINLLIFALIFIPSGLLFGGVLFFIYQTETAAIQQVIANKESGQVRLQQEILAEDIDGIIEELKAISGSHEMVKIINGLTHDTPGTINDLVNLAILRGAYDQIRYIDQTGMEILRVNYKHGQAAAVPADQLQNKAQRYYFQQTMSLVAGQVFISPMDLNIEQGDIEQPLKPMIRFGIPVFNRHSEARGIIMLNYLARNSLDNLARIAQQNLGRFSLLNPDGYWLKGPDPDREWGFMYEQKQEQTFGHQYPAEWARLNSAEAGQFLTANGLFTFASFYPPSYSEGNAPATTTPYHFKIISHITAPTYRQETRHIFNRLALIYVAIIIILLIGAETAASLVVQRRRARNEREALIEQLQSALSEVKNLQGLIPICSYCKKIRDDEGSWNQLEAYICKHTDAKFSHSICSECMNKHYPEIDTDNSGSNN